MTGRMNIPVTISDELHEQRWYFKFKRMPKQARIAADGEFELIDASSR